MVAVVFSGRRCQVGKDKVEVSVARGERIVELSGALDAIEKEGLLSRVQVAKMREQLEKQPPSPEGVSPHPLKGEDLQLGDEPPEEDVPLADAGTPVPPKVADYWNALDGQLPVYKGPASPPPGELTEGDVPPEKGPNVEFGHGGFLPGHTD